MSRYTAFNSNSGNFVAYGFDHAVGYFYQEYDNENDDPVIDVDSLFHGLTGVRLAEYLKNTTANSDHIRKCILDLEI